MNINDILSKVDHTLLSPTARFSDIKQIIDDGITYKTASVCIPPCFVKQAAEYASSRVRICTVIGFPNGYMTNEAKCFEAANAIANGADEIDMVINLGLLKDAKYDELLSEIRAVKAACGCRVLKVIIETCLLTDDEKIKMCKIVSESGADYIKTSTGFSVGGATREDIILFKQNIADHVKIKAAGGISSLADAEDFINLGASRLGTSRIVKLVKNESTSGY
ncbi:MAG: deoxyribose-phosphate aldolase [Clostridia bacterium]|nr:deoxyribose-phosphate aldolase [Clostridia bacterium]